MKLSLCIATYNEEKFIHYPLDSAYDIVDEVVIVDGGSTDRTIEIAKAYGQKVRVIESDNPPMFHKNKEKAIRAAKGEWILQLDADEALSEELRKEIVNLLQIQNSKIKNQNKIPKLKNDVIESETELSRKNSKVAYWLPRQNYFLGRFLMKGGVYPDYTIRLYKNGAVRFPCRSVHENVELIENLNTGNSLKIENCQSKIGYLKSPLLHYADPDFKRYLKRWDRYTTLDAEILRQELKNQNSKIKTIGLFVQYIFIKPVSWFFSAYFRHLGFLDGWQGLVFHFFSSIRFWAIYYKLMIKSRKLKI